ncbi:hypothetical protein BGX26_002353 [Mortierella sp. AD094]|nr:hypothetical protein BGX26_002353 [Mortierella sp. AD094]
MSAHIEDEPEFNERHRAQDAAPNIHPIIDEANHILCSNVEISDKVLEITISGPTLTLLTIIDSPGYINTTVDDQGKSIVETVRTINTGYIKDSRTIILAVVPANVDLNNIFVLGESERYDPTNERTIPIVTKPDTVEPDLLPNLIYTLLNKRKFMKLGYLVMKNSAFKDIDISWDEARQHEDNFFKSSELWRQVPENRKGRISKELPFLKKEILDLIGGCEKEIVSMGPEVSNITVAKARYFESILNLRSSLTALLDGNYSAEYISKHKLDITNDLSAATKDNNNDNNTFEGISDDDGTDDNSDDDFPPLLNEGDNYFIRSSLHRLYQRYNHALSQHKYILTADKMNELVLVILIALEITSYALGNSLPFGNCACICFGDFGQLSPVSRSGPVPCVWETRGPDYVALNRYNLTISTRQQG